MTSIVSINLLKVRTYCNFLENMKVYQKDPIFILEDTQHFHVLALPYNTALGANKTVTKLKYQASRHSPSLFLLGDTFGVQITHARADAHAYIQL